MCARIVWLCFRDEAGQTLIWFSKRCQRSVLSFDCCLGLETSTYASGHFIKSESQKLKAWSPSTFGSDAPSTLGDRKEFSLPHVLGNKKPSSNLVCI